MIMIRKFEKITSYHVYLLLIDLREVIVEKYCLELMINR